MRAAAPEAPVGPLGREWGWVVAYALVLFVSRLIASTVLPIYDDAFITFRYGRNLAFGLGLVYHPGEWVLGTTTPLFALLSGALYALQLPMPATAAVLNAGLDVLLLIVTLMHVPRGLWTPAAALFATLYAVDPIVARVSVGAMEMSLFVTLSMLAISACTRGRWVPGFALASLSCFVRPEGVLLAAILGGACVVRDGLRHFLKALWPGLVLGLAGVLVLTILYGSPVPQSLASKLHSEMSRPGVFAVVHKLLAYEPLLAVCLPAAAWGIVVVFRRPQSLFFRLLALWGAAYVAVYAVARPFLWSWYGAATYYIVLAFAALGLGQLLGRVLDSSKPLPRLLWRRVLPLLPALAIFVWVGVRWVRGPSPVTENVFRALRSWCAAHETADASFFAIDIGALGYYSNGRIYDRAGLVWPSPDAVLPSEAFLRKYEPDYLYMNANTETKDLLDGEPWRRLYRPVARFSRSGSRDLTLQDAGSPELWVQDYILYERVEPGP